MKKVKVGLKVKKLFSCLMALILVMLSCDNGLSAYAAEPETYAVNDEFTEGELKYRVIDEENRYVEIIDQYINSDKLLEIAAVVEHNGDTYSVTRIGEKAFFNCNKLTGIVIPEGVKEIEAEAFSECKYLESISLPGSLERIGVRTFSGSGTNIDELKVTIAEGVKYIDTRAFMDCHKLKEIIIPSSVEEMKSATFVNCYALEKVIIKGKIKQLSDSFMGCNSLKYIEIPNSVTEIRPTVFLGCIALESITLPASVELMDALSVGNCKELREMRIAVQVKNEDTVDVKPISLYDQDVNTTWYQALPADRKLVFLTEDGTRELTGSNLVAVQNAYKQVDDGDTTDNLWYGWKIGDIAKLYNVTIDVKKDGEDWENHGKQFRLKDENGNLTEDFLVESGTYTVCVVVGTNIIDTGVTVEVDGNDTNVTIEYFTVTFYDNNTPYENASTWGQQIVRKDEYAVMPGSDPEKNDFKFAGWKTDKEGSKAFDFEAGITDKTDIYASWSKDSGDSTEPAKPTDTEKPTEQPTKPTDTENPPAPSKPTDTENPPDSSNPTGTENPTAPSKPADTETPPAPSKPTDTEKPADSNNPADTETTITPNNPTDSETPSIPSPSLNSNGSSELEEPEASAPIGGAEEDEKPETGDTNHVEIYATAAMIAGLSYVMLMFAKHREGMTEEEKNLRVTAWLEWAGKGSRFRKYVALTAIFFLLLYYHSIGKQLDLKWKEIYGD